MNAPTTGPAGPSARCGLGRVLADITAEREAQHAVWGVQHHLPDGTGPRWRGRADAARHACERAAATGQLTWRHILLEEVAEALAEDDPALLRGELVQIGAVVAQWLQAIDHRGTLTRIRALGAPDDGRPPAAARSADRLDDGRTCSVTDTLTPRRGGGGG